MTNRLVSWFGISRQQASSDIKKYNSLYNPESLIHDPAVKAYVPKAGFRPVLTKGHINEYLDMISGLVSESVALVMETEDHIASVQLPDRSVRPEVVREILRACRTQTSIKIIYASMSNPAWAERIISPHNLVYTGFRWHVRAFCHKRQEFRDFILSRIERAPKPSESPAPPVSDDLLWNQRVQLTLVPNPNLSEAQKLLVEADYGMPDGRLQLSVRKALAHYTLQRYQVAITDEDSIDQYRHPLTLLPADRQKLSPYLFGHGSQ